MNYPEPHIIEFEKVGDPSIGFISIAQFNHLLPFDVKRVFWMYLTPEEIMRGRHAHYQTQQVLVAAAGTIIVTTEKTSGEKKSFTLDKPNIGVYIPPDAWHTMQYFQNSVQLVFASTEFDPSDYIRDFEEFKKIYG